MTPAKRASDLILALMLSVLLAPVALLIAALILLRDGTPVFYVSERMKAPAKPFMLWKFRTMQNVEKDTGVSGGDKLARITATGRILRRMRLDEIPQLWNIIRGDMSFVGPRPPLRRYVDMQPDLYAQVLRNVPGVTGLATLAFHRTEEHLLASCKTPEETEQVYVRRCVPKKARLDLIYAQNRTLCYDYLLMLATLFRKLPLKWPK